MIVRVDHDGSASGAANMARDLSMLEDVRNNVADILFRTYTWEPWCVSLGRNQPETSIDAERCEASGFDIVRRPTGGRAVLHANELTYCIVVRLGPSRTARDVYARVHEALFAILTDHIPDLAFSGVPTDLRTHYASSGALGQVCFTSHARSEIMSGTRKVVGSAQRVIDGIVLQHGSILCGSGHERISDLVHTDERQREFLQAEIGRSSVTLSELAQREVLPVEVVRWLTSGDENIETYIRRSFDHFQDTH
ncbi:MAG: lipoate--protein ligase family protein [Candidatus Kapabacteria bacterium]|nr:lipoate--protein ligase family protein [Candidatus Kapabacteria bacterium]